MCHSVLGIFKKCVSGNSGSFYEHLSALESNLSSSHIPYVLLSDHCFYHSIIFLFLSIGYGTQGLARQGTKLHPSFVLFLLLQWIISM